MTQPLPLTALLACLLALWILILTWRVIRRRRTDRIVLGDNDDRSMQKAIRGQANAVEQIPIFLIVFALAEMGGAPAWALKAIGAVFLAGRLAHGIYFSWPGVHWRLRVWGMLGTLIGQGLVILSLASTILF